MKSKSKKSKSKYTKQPRMNYKAAATDLASCVVFALKYLDTKSGSGMRVRVKRGGGIERIERWQDTFFDALDKVGVVVDRDEYWTSKTERTAKAQTHRA